MQFLVVSIFSNTGIKYAAVLPVPKAIFHQDTTCELELVVLVLLMGAGVVDGVAKKRGRDTMTSPFLARARISRPPRATGILCS